MPKSRRGSRPMSRWPMPSPISLAPGARPISWWPSASACSIATWQRVAGNTSGSWAKDPPPTRSAPTRTGPFAPIAWPGYRKAWHPPPSPRWNRTSPATTFPSTSCGIGMRMACTTRDPRPSCAPAWWWPWACPCAASPTRRSDWDRKWPIPSCWTSPSTCAGPWPRTSDAWVSDCRYCARCPSSRESACVASCDPASTCRYYPTRSWNGRTSWRSPVRANSWRWPSRRSAVPRPTGSAPISPF